MAEVSAFRLEKILLCLWDWRWNEGGGRGAVFLATRLFCVSSTRLWSCSGTWTRLLSCEGFSNLPHAKPSVYHEAFFSRHCCRCNFKYRCGCIPRPEAHRCPLQNVSEIQITGIYNHPSNEKMSHLEKGKECFDFRTCPRLACVVPVLMIFPSERVLPSVFRNRTLYYNDSWVIKHIVWRLR